MAIDGTLLIICLPCAYFLSLIGAAHSVLHFVSVISNPPVNYTAALAIPAYDVAFFKVQELYPDVFRHVIHHPVVLPGPVALTCEEEADSLYNGIEKVVLLLRSFHRSVLLQTPACSALARILGDYARELDAPFLISTALAGSLADKTRYPTLVSFTPTDGASLTGAAIAFMERHRWKTATLLCGIQSRSVSAFDVYACQNLASSLAEKRSSGYESSVIRFDPDVIENITSILLIAKSQSRIIFLMGTTSVLRNVMVRAYHLNMTDGNYVWKGAYDPLILYAAEEPDWNALGTTVNSFAEQGKVDVSEFGAVNVAAFDGVLAAAKILNETGNTALLPGADFARKFRNRHFVMDSGLVKFDRNGFRLLDVLFYRVHIESASQIFSRQVTWRYLAALKELQAVSNTSEIWTDGMTSFPSDRPSCDLDGKFCTVDTITSKQIPAIVSTCVGGVFIALLTCGIYFVRKQRTTGTDLNDGWWIIDCGTTG